MGTITKSDNGSVKVTYDNRKYLKESEICLLRYSFEVFSYLVKKSEKITFQELISRILETYDLTYKIKECISIIEKVSIKYKFTCKYNIDGVGKDFFVCVESSSFSNVGSLLSEIVSSKIKELSLIGMSYSYKKGVLSFL